LDETMVEPLRTARDRYETMKEQVTTKRVTMNTSIHTMKG